MEDYEVRLVMNRGRLPLLVPNFSFRTIKRESHLHIYRLTLDITNKGMVRATDLSLHIWWPHKVNFGSRGSLLKKWEKEIIDGEVYSHIAVQIFGSELVIFPKQSYPLILPDLGEFHIEYGFDQKTYEARPFFLHWELYGGDSPCQKGKVSFDQLNEW